jgi:hypothetical protein
MTIIAYESIQGSRSTETGIIPLFMGEAREEKDEGSWKGSLIGSRSFKATSYVQDEVHDKARRAP